MNYSIPIDYTKLNKDEIEPKAEFFYNSALNTKTLDKLPKTTIPTLPKESTEEKKTNENENSEMPNKEEQLKEDTQEIKNEVKNENVELDNVNDQLIISENKEGEN